MKLRPAVSWLVLVPSLALAGDGPQRADVPRGADPPALVDPGVHVELSLTPGHARAESPLAFAFTIRDKTTALPLAGLRPAAWLSTRTEAGAASGRDCVRKAATFIGGSLMHRPALDLNAYYVLALNDDASVSVVDPRFGFGGSQLLAMLRLESRGEDWTLSPDGSRLFVSMPDAGKIAVADTVSWEVTRGIEVGTRPTRVALQPDGSQLWALTDDGLTAIDVRSLDVAGRIVAPGASAFAFTTDSRSVAVAASGGVIVAGTRGRGDAPARVVLSFTPRALAFSPAAQLAYAADPITGAIAAVDLATRTVVARLEAEPGFTQLRFSPSGRYGFLPNPGKHVVQIFDTASNRIVRTADVSAAPDQVTFSDRLAYIRRRDSDTILMLPLDQLSTEGTGVGLADFTGGQHAMGRGRFSALADSIVQAPDGLAVLVANPADRAIYYYREGMAAPMGGFNNYSREPRAVLVVDRSLRERPDGVYVTTVTVDAPGRYDAIFFLDAPRVVTCFAVDVGPPDPSDATTADAAAGTRGLAKRHAAKAEATVEPLEWRARAAAGTPVRVRFRLSDPATRQPIAASDVTVLAMQAPGVWQRREAARAVGDGVYEVEVTPPSDGVYYVWVTSASAGLPVNNRQFLVLRVE